jgi:RNA polymerase sigma factor (sigma-70 family)
MSKPIINIESWKNGKRDAIYLEHRKIIPAIAQNILRVMPPGTELNDLIQIGEIALLENALKYKDGWGPIEAYLGQRIRWAILREMEGRLARARHEIAISQIGTEDDGQRLLESQAISAEQEESLMSDDSVMREAVTSLTGREQQILKLRFIDGLDQEQAGEVLGISGTESETDRNASSRERLAQRVHMRKQGDRVYAEVRTHTTPIRLPDFISFETSEQFGIPKAARKVYSISAVTPERRKRAIKRSRAPIAA